MRVCIDCRGVPLCDKKLKKNIRLDFIVEHKLHILRGGNDIAQQFAKTSFISHYYCEKSATL